MPAEAPQPSLAIRVQPVEGLKLFTKKEVANLLSVSEKTVEAYIYDPDHSLTYTHQLSSSTKSFRICAAALRDWLESRRV